MTEQKVTLRYLRIAPRKVRAVADLVRGLSVNDAEAQLMLLTRRATKPILKLLRSGVAAVKASKKMNLEKLIVGEIRVDQGPMLKRYMMRAQGSASEIQKKMSHVTIALRESDTVRPPRFKVVVPKKVRLSPEDIQKIQKARPKKEGEKETVKPARAGKKPGFFKKVFSRHTAMGGE